MNIRSMMLGFTAIAAAASTSAQAPVALPAAAAPPASACELHVFPAERFQAMTTGLLGGGLIDAAMHADGDKARRSHLASALDSEGQLAALTSIDFAAAIGHAGDTVITHPEALDRKTVNKIQTRRSASTSACYSELIVTDVLYMRSTMLGRSLHSSFMLRDFGAASAKPVIYRGMGGDSLKIFPAKEGTDTTAADAELVSTFQKNFAEAARNITKKRKKA